MDFPKLIPSILWGFLIFTIMSLGFFNIISSAGIESDNTTMPFENTLTVANNITTSVKTQGTSTANTFFPALPTIFQVWGLMTTALDDIAGAVNQFWALIGVGENVTLLNVVLWASISIGITFIILSILFRFGGTKDI
jgi:hypothetical protein